MQSGGIFVTENGERERLERVERVEGVERVEERREIHHVRLRK
jgi:hypothetical protein